MGDSKALDVFGIKGFSDSVRIATEGLRDGAGALLSRLCLPAAEEIGLAFRDRVSAWRARNALTMLNEANSIYLGSPFRRGDDQLSPRLVHVAVEEASWNDDAQVRSMWAGLLAASAAPGTSDENLIFMNLLKQLTALEVRILEFAVERAPKRVAHGELVVAVETEQLSIRELLDRLCLQDIHRLDRELDHLRELGLIGPFGGGAGIDLQSGKVSLTPTPLALHLYIRGHGSKLSPIAYWKVEHQQTPGRNSAWDDFNRDSGMSGRPSEYEHRARQQIHDWKNPEKGWFGQMMERIGWLIDRLRTLLKNAPDASGLFDVITKAVAGIVGVLVDAATWTVRPEAVYAEFRKAGHDVRQPADLLVLDLEQIDEVVSWLDVKYKGLAAGEGAVTGATGAPGLIADIPALVGLNLRAIGEYATYYGFDVASQRERLFAMHVLGLASSPDRCGQDSRDGSVGENRRRCRQEEGVEGP